MPFSGIISEEDNLTRSRARRSGQTFDEQFRLFLSRLIANGVKPLIQLVWLDTSKAALLVDNALMQQVDGDFHHGSTRALTVTGL